MNAPELWTERLQLRPVRPADAAALHRHWTEPGVRRYLWDGQLVTRAEVREAIRTSSMLFERDGAGLWLIRARDRRGVLGCGGFWWFHEPPQRELVLSLSAAHQGKGYAAEAGEALLAHAFAGLGWVEVQGSTDAPNEASLRLMRRLGMRWRGRSPGPFGTTETYAIDRAAWLASRSASGR